MIECTSLEQCSFQPGDQVALALGVFDGLHTAHKRIIRECIQRAKARSGKSVIFTFQNHPISILRPEHSPSLLTPYPLKRQLIEQTGVDVLLAIRFNTRIAHTPARQFVERILHEQLSAREIVIGFNFHFGHHREGTPELLKEYVPTLFSAVTVVASQSTNSVPISSTLIRQNVQQGELDFVRQLLERPYQLCGKVIRGAGRGRTIGIPTANIDCSNQVLPPNGVYGVQLRTGSLNAKPFRGVMNIGTVPTFTDQSQRTVEVHVLDQDLDLYDQFVIVDLMTYIRKERKFSGPQELVAQIQRDIAQFREWHNT